MRIFGFNISRSTPPVRKSLTPTAMEWLRGEDLNSAGARLKNAYPQSAWVYRAVSVLAEQVANIPFRFSVGEAGGEHLITRGPLLDFYGRPHPQINRFQYWELRVIWLMLRGECVRVPIYEGQSGRTGRTGQTVLKKVLILDPARFQHIVENNELIGWRYTGFGPRAPLASQVFLPEEVWFERLPNPYDFWRGLPPLYAASEAARTDFAAGIFMQGLIENNGDTGLIVRSEKPLSDEQHEQLNAAIRDRRCRAGAANEPLVLSGVTQMIKPELSSSDLQFLENRKFSRAEICAAFGVPEEIITTTDGAKYDVMAGARLNFIENRVAPLCRRLEAEEEITVKALDPNAAGWFDLDSLPIMQQARQGRLAAAQTGFGLGVPFNELNRVLDLGFKPLAWGDRGYVAGGWKEIGESTKHQRGESTKHQHPSTSEAPSSKLQGGEAAGAVDRALEFLSGRRFVPGAPASVPASQLIGIRAGRDAGAAGSAERVMVAGKLRRFFFEQRGRVLGKLAGAGDNSIGPISPIGPIGPIRAAMLLPAPEALLDVAAENARLAGRLQPVAISEGVANEINRTTLAALREACEAAVAAGESREELSARVKRLYNEAGGARAKELAERLGEQG